MTESNKFRVAITDSLELVERGEHAEALNLLDQSIVKAKREHDVSWIRTLCHHAAIVSRFTGNFASAQRYYEESLAADPENARALYGLATVALDGGDLEIARQYAERCHTAVSRLENDDVLKQGLLDLVLKHWPDIAEKPG
jgi:Tfp pilus assembly protein PilF